MSCTNVQQQTTTTEEVEEKQEDITEWNLVEAKMGKVAIKPMPESFKRVSKYRPQPAPVFPDCGLEGPTEEDKRLAIALFKLLDSGSREWYRRNLPGLFADE